MSFDEPCVKWCLLFPRSYDGILHVVPEQLATTQDQSRRSAPNVIGHRVQEVRRAALRLSAS